MNKLYFCDPDRHKDCPATYCFKGLSMEEARSRGCCIACVNPLYAADAPTDVQRVVAVEQFGPLIELSTRPEMEDDHKKS